MSCNCSQAPVSGNTDFQYAVKIVCGEIREANDKNPLSIGEYFTAVNVHNPARCDSVTFRWKVAVGLPGLKVGEVTDFSEATLGPDEALEIDCRDILKRLGKKTFAKGWVVIETEDELDVVAVYSASKEMRGKIDTFHTERVKPRCLAKCKDFGLNISTGVAAWQVKPPNSNSFSLSTITTPHPAWSIVPQSLWVTVPPGASAAPAGQYVYQLAFYLCSGFRNPSLWMNLLSDDSSTVELNGNLIGTSQAAPYTNISNISTNSFFRIGLNLLTVTLKNAGREQNPTGLDIQGFIDADSGLCAGKPMPLLACPGVCYRAHVKNEGWHGTVCNGETAGTTGQSRRLEAYQVWLTNAPPGTTIEYNGHLANFGWSGWIPEGGVCGTVGESRRMEAIQIRLINAPLNCRVRYQVHMKNLGWSGWKYDGEEAGTTGQSRQIEAIQIVIE